MGDDPSELAADPSQYDQDPSQYGQDPSQYGQDPSQYGQDPSQYGQDPSQYSQDPSQYSQDPSQYSQDPSHYGQDPSHYGQDPSRYGQDPSGYGQQSCGYGHEAWQTDQQHPRQAEQWGQPAVAVSEQRPAQGDPSGSGASAHGSATAGGQLGGHTSALKVALAQLKLGPALMTDGTTAVNGDYDLTNNRTETIDAGALTVGAVAFPRGSSGEQSASVSFVIDVPVRAGDTHKGGWAMQLDPGTWDVTMQVSETVSSEVLGSTDPTSVIIAGRASSTGNFDDSKTYELEVMITSVVHIDSLMYRVHYTLTNNSDRTLPAGLTVEGVIEGGSTSDQTYNLQSPLAARQNHEHYLTLEANPQESQMMVTITADVNGPSRVSDHVVVTLGTDGTPTVRR